LCFFFYQVKDEDEGDEEEKKKDAHVKEFFLKLAGDDMEVDWMELKEIMDYAMRNGKRNSAPKFQTTTHDIARRIS